VNRKTADLSYLPERQVGRKWLWEKCRLGWVAAITGGRFCFFRGAVQFFL